ncbi:outer membrane beta-barrel protein [Coraliomargarita akajimensis]|uniref:OmpA domain protein transmembrane region-containing protein n=1 Tax=Coraliomargarita akajimensis (strain DSM 45221 / IAM 15411 / JCM 23193 / KCTC 12865 / 04OKA010-24) TaxID=583355 RepID=D5EKY0_CORAD|nr:outer membrane beta-barrel protein [Coraliomargarita akajimensis]ADE53082.1 OmpA domain protein transmembrane region- containing protein [Coraliomargarita akajimensis DSM 45221]
MQLGFLNDRSYTSHIALALISVTTTSSLLAEDEGQAYIGLNSGLMLIDSSVGYEDPVSLGVYGGYQFSDMGFAIEGQMTLPISSAESGIASAGDLDIFTLGVYGVWRSPGRVYFKGKAGFMYEYLSTDFAGFPLEESGFGLSLGVGGGVRITKTIAAELEYTIIETDIDYLSLGLTYSF